MNRLMISVIIVLLSVYGTNAQTVVGAACVTEDAMTPTSFGCDFYHLCTGGLIVLRRCTAPQTFNIDTNTCSATPSCTLTTPAPTAPNNVPTAPGPNGSTLPTDPVTESTLPGESTLPTESTLPGESTLPTESTLPVTQPPQPTPSVPTVPTVTPPVTQPPVTQPSVTQPPATQPTQPTPTGPPSSSLWPTGPITCTVAGPTYHGHHIRCDQFQICSNGQIFLRDCPPQQHWAPTLSRCDWIRVANCPHPF